MRIAHIVLSIDTGGQERFILNLSRELVHRGHEVSVVTMTPGGDLRREFAGVRIVDVPREGGRSALSLFARLSRALRALMPDVVHTHNPPPLIYGALAARAALVRRVVHTKHGANPFYTRSTLALARVATRTLTAFVSVSEGTGETARLRERPSSRIAHVIPNGVPLEQFGADKAARARVRAELGIPDGAVVLGSVGRLAAEKDYPLLVRAVAPLLSERTRLVLVGEGDQRVAIESEVRRCLSEEQRSFVCLTGTRRDVADLFAAFDVFVLSSKTEGLPLVIPEAMASRLPVVATAVGGVPSVVPHEVGCLVPSGDEVALRVAIAALVQAGDRRLAMGEAAHAFAHEHFSLSRMTSKYERLYEGRS